MEPGAATIRMESAETPSDKLFYALQLGFDRVELSPQSPMRPTRVHDTHQSVLGWVQKNQLENKVAVFDSHSKLLTGDEIAKFHTSDFMRALKEGCDPNSHGLSAEGDCPWSKNLHADYIIPYATGSVRAAEELAEGNYKRAINWAGGMHHAFAGEAAGFCFVNDIVLAILVLLSRFTRVLYIDLDAHHGDGVENAFLTSARVLTLSVHHAYLWPGSGKAEERGEGAGHGYSVNVPLAPEEMTDAAYLSIVRPILQAVVTRFRPSAVVLQCGTDVLAGDRLVEESRLSIGAQAAVVQWVRDLHIPLLALGGGGYTPETCVRAWTLYTTILMGCNLDAITTLADGVTPVPGLPLAAPLAYLPASTQSKLDGILNSIRTLVHSVGDENEDESTGGDLAQPSESEVKEEHSASS